MLTISLSPDGLSFNTMPFGERTVREHKGKSLIDLPDNYCIIDIETTGLSPVYDDIIEIGCLKVENNTIISEYNTLVNPGYEIDEYIQNLTGISNEMLASAPKLKDVLGDFIKFIGDNILVGHNVHFDINFLYDACNRLMSHFLSNNFVDTMRLARKMHPELEHHRLCDIVGLYNIDADEAHRAIKDCMMTYKCFLELKKEIIAKYETCDNFKKKYHTAVRADEIVSTKEFIDENSPFVNKVCVFTGVLEKMARRDAMQIVADLGGINADNVTAKTNFLILGNNDYCSNIKDGKSNKQKKAEKMKLEGKDICIIPETVFYDMIGDSLQ